MRILVTGGCGFIGSNFIRLVLGQDEKTEIVNLDKLTYAGNLANLADLPPDQAARHRFVKGDITDRALVSSLLEQEKPDALVHFAAESHVDRSITDATPFVTTNVLGTQVLLDCARQANIPRMVHVSTDEVYGTLGAEGRFREDTPLAPNSPYSASKAASDMLVRAAHETFGQNVVITRCSNNYGPYQFPEKLIPLMTERARRGEALPVYGTGSNVRDWIHVEDHCRGVLLALEKGRPGAVYNFGGDAERTNLEVVRAILRLTGRDESLIRFVKDRPGHDLRYAMDHSLASRELGFAPQKTFETGLQETVRWYENHEEWVRQVESGAYRDFEKLWYGERL
ncbi:MAG TPA: dTDP-glucose 4,6-dehydratase [Candidatus Mailhella merdavium]|nr:dTDP-glucose 4,6-dehydratase [Candidatus Mailhella merdavium]